MASMSGFVREFRVFLRGISSGWDSELDVQEFRRWMVEDLVPFTKVSAHDQFCEKINYEVSIGNKGASFYEISEYLEEWLKVNEEKPVDYIWYHGTTEGKLEEILMCGVIMRSGVDGFERAIGTVSLAKSKRDATFFSAIGEQSNQILLFIDGRMLDHNKMKYRKLFNMPKGEMIYSGDVPLSAVFLIERL